MVEQGGRKGGAERAQRLSRKNKDSLFYQYDASRLHTAVVSSGGRLARLPAAPLPPSRAKRTKEPTAFRLLAAKRKK